MKWLSVLILSAAAFAQSGPTTVPGPLIVTVPNGTSPTSIISLTPATAQYPCVYVGPSDIEFCGQDGTVTINSGSGWVNLVGAKGDKGDPGVGTQGPQGIPGVSITGPQGIPGIPGPPGQGISWPITITCATATAAKGGKGVPNFSVTTFRLANCSLSK